MAVEPVATPTDSRGGEHPAQDQEVSPPDAMGDGPTRVRRRWPGVVCCLLYAVVALIEYGHYSLMGPSHMSGNGTMDTTEQIWWLAWTAHTLPHLHALFTGQGQNYPFGQNFGVNGSMLTLSVLFTPVTKLFGPVVAWNILLRLSIAVSAASMCFVLRRWTTWWPAAFVGGLLYGFSAYTDGVSAYLFLIFVPLPPLIFLLLHEIVVRQRWRSGRTGLLLAVLCVIQFFISTEILASTVVMGVIAIALVIIVHRRTLAQRWRYAVTAFGYALGAVALLLWYPVWFTFAGPQHIPGGPASPANNFSEHGDLLSVLMPTQRQWLDPTHLAPVRQFTVANQNYRYTGLLFLSVPLLVALVLFAIFLRKRRTILFAGTMAVAAFVLALGPTLWVDGHETTFTLPFAVLQHLPALSGLLAIRFTLYLSLFAAGMFAIGLDEVWRRMTSPARRAGGHTYRSRVAAILVAAVLAAVVILPLVPATAHPIFPTGVPRFFTSAAIDSIPPGSVVLAYPYPDGPVDHRISNSHYTRSIMLDQAVAADRFTLIGGYGWFPKPHGSYGTTDPARLDPQSIQTLFDENFRVATPEQRALVRKSDLPADLREFLRKHDVQTVIILPGEHHPRSLIHTLSGVLGPPTRSGGVTLWFHVTPVRTSEPH
jgi:hypothetical protein